MNWIVRGHGDHAWKVEWPVTGSLILVAAAEIYEFKANDLIETWKHAIAKMRCRR